MSGISWRRWSGWWATLWNCWTWPSLKNTSPTLTWKRTNYLKILCKFKNGWQGKVLRNFERLWIEQIGKSKTHLQKWTLSMTKLIAQQNVIWISVFISKWQRNIEHWCARYDPVGNTVILPAGVLKVVHFQFFYQFLVCLSVLSSSRSWLSVINEWWNSIILTTPCMMDFHHKETLIYPSLYDSYTLKFCKYLLINVFRAFSLEGTVQNIWTTGALAMLSGMRWRTVLTTRAGCVFLCICKYLVVFVFVYYLHTDIYISVL